jgi:NAD+ diphosphatase
MDDSKPEYTPVAFVQSGYDRHSLYRDRGRYLKSCLDDGSARFLFIYDRKVGLRRTDAGFEAALICPDLIPRAQRDALEAIFLGELGAQPVFSIGCDDHPRSLLSLASDPLLFLDLRQASSMLQPHAASLLGYALAMDHWHRSHRYCGACGHSTATGAAGHVRICGNTDCARKHFPRTDPAVIVLVHNDEACLLGRKREWVDRRYSTIAGFVEPGETPEQAVLREVYEETGTAVTHVRYHAAQPWPFPGSLMLGYYARATPGPVTLHDNELQDARWFTRAEIAEWVPQGRLRLPSRVSIAYRLLEHWFDQYEGPALDTLNPDTAN